MNALSNLPKLEHILTGGTMSHNRIDRTNRIWRIINRLTERGLRIFVACLLDGKGILDAYHIARTYI